jgi:hypothetical protein
MRKNMAALLTVFRRTTYIVVRQLEGLFKGFTSGKKLRNLPLDRQPISDNMQLNVEVVSMKRALVFTAAMAVAASSAFSQVTQVVSRNAVGYVKVETQPGNKFVLCAIPFNEVGGDGDYKINEIIGNQLTPGNSPASADQIIKFNPISQTYLRHWKAVPFGNQFVQLGQNVATTNTLKPGEAFFILNNQTTNQSVFLLGEVPDRFTVPTTTQTVQFIGGGFQFASYSFPVEVAINDTKLLDTAIQGNTPATSDQIIRFDPITQAYVRYWTQTGQGHWARLGTPPTTPTTDKLKPAEGIIYSRQVSGGAFQWKEGKPYTWP